MFADLPAVAPHPLDQAALAYHWPAWARPNQIPPEGDWDVCVFLAGRGWGKTRVGVEWLRAGIAAGTIKRAAIIASTAADARDTIVQGESGILQTSPPWFRPKYEPTKRLLTWPNGGEAHLYTSEEPDHLRGPQHDAALCDELAAWANLRETWDNLHFGLRLGKHPKVVVTTTPRPLATLRQIVTAQRTIVVKGHTKENASNLARPFLARIQQYEGTALGRQELEAEILDDRQGAVFHGDWIRKVRKDPPPFVRVVVAIDPAMTVGGDETGIVIAGLTPEGIVWILEDLSGRHTPDAWASLAIDAYDRWKADAIVYESNRHGEMPITVIRSSLKLAKRAPHSIRISRVHASRGKATRAEPVAALYEQGRILHVQGLDLLERQMVAWIPGPSGRDDRRANDRIDAMVWAVFDLACGADHGSIRDGFKEALAATQSFARGGSIGMALAIGGEDEDD